MLAPGTCAASRRAAGPLAEASATAYGERVSENPGPVALIAEFTTTEENRDEVAGLIAGYGDVVRAEPGNRAFDVYTHVAEPTKFWVHEIYADRAAFEAHIGAQAGKDFNARLVPLINEPESVLTFLTPVTERA